MFCLLGWLMSELLHKSHTYMQKPVTCSHNKCVREHFHSRTTFCTQGDASSSLMSARLWGHKASSSSSVTDEQMFGTRGETLTACVTLMCKSHNTTGATFRPKITTATCPPFSSPSSSSSSSGPPPRPILFPQVQN